MIKHNTKKNRFVIFGETLCPGFAEGRAFIYQDILSRDLITYSISKDQIKQEMGRIGQAMGRVVEDLKLEQEKIRRHTNGSEADIFEFHKGVLRDKSIWTKIERELELELTNAEQAVRSVFRKLAGRLKASPSDRIRTKAADIDDLSRRVLRVLLGYEMNPLEEIPSKSIIIARRLLPSDTVHIKRRNLGGIIVKEGSTYSHAAILACGLGITAIANPDRPLGAIRNGDEILLDGYNGKIVVNPAPADREIFARVKADFLREQERHLKSCPRTTRTKDGTRVLVYANVSSKDDIKMARIYCFEGVGLFRTEQLYLLSKTLPDEDEIIRNLKPVLEEAAGKHVYLRLLDAGGDKNLPYVEVPDEMNPFLGLRGVRFLLRHRDILKTQGRAFLRLAQKFNIKILIPMVTLAGEIAKIKAALAECRTELESERKQTFILPPVGVMIETPAAVINIHEIIAQADFLSIGTNDLIQYIMAAGRENIDVADYYEKGSGTALPFIAQVVAAAAKQKIEVSICGEMAGDVKWTKALLETGLRILSVSPAAIPELKKTITRISLT